MLPMRWAPEATVTTRPRTRSSSRLASAKWPRWLVPNCSSKPSAVRPKGGTITPALLISSSISPSHEEANSRTEARLARSSARTSVSPGIAAAAARPRSRSRTASTVRAPARASACAAARPMPLLAPVTIAVRPVMSGMSAAVKVVMANNVDDANKDVNDNIIGYACRAMATAAISTQTHAPERPYHHGDLRRTLLEQAERTLRERGVQALSLRELAREAGVSHSAPRRHFADRQALLDALAQDGFARLGETLRRAASRTGEDYESRLRATAAAYVRFATRDPALLELMFAGKHREPAGALHEAAERAFAAMLELIVQGQESGAIEAGDPERVGLVLFATVQGIAALVGAGIVASGQIDQLVSDAVARFLHGPDAR
jgi:AcrR family transcriptional regulator